MASGWKGIAVGVVGLALLEATVSSNAAATRVGSVPDAFARWIRRWVDPTVPLFSTTPATSSSAGSAANPKPIAPGLGGAITGLYPPGGAPAGAPETGPGGTTPQYDFVAPSTAPTATV